MSRIVVDTVQPNPTRGPACTKCNGPTRLTGVEPHPTEPHTDLRTYQCLACDNVQAKLVPIAN
jgi:hypothetical protein